MPIVKVPIVHKFGIISHSQRLELQERLLREAYTKSLDNKHRFVSTKNPYEVSEEFVKKYNHIMHEGGSAEAKNKIEDEAQRLLQRVRRRAGLRDAGQGSHVNVPLAWTELTLMAQCRGKVHQDCLDVLLLSLDQSSCGQYQIPALFYLAETVLYWLQTETTQQPFLRSSEVKLLKIGELVFFHLYYHHMSTHLTDHQEACQRLSLYLDGLEVHHSLYEPYPNACLSFLVVVSIGKAITGDGDLAVTTESAAMSARAESSEIVHELSPTLWHSLDVWRCARNLGGDLRNALLALFKCAQSLQSSNWVDNILALSVVGDAAREDGDCLRALIALGRGETASTRVDATTKKATLQEEQSPLATDRKNLSVVVTGGGSGLHGLSDIHELSEGSSSPFDSTRMTFSKPASEVNTPRTVERSPRWSLLAHEPRGLATWPWQVAVVQAQLLTQVSLHGSTSGIRQMALTELCALSELQQPTSTQTEDENQQQLLWRIRYAALVGLVSVCQATAEDSDRECQRNVAWTAVIRAQKKEKDAKVLEALKLGSIEGHLEKLLNESVKVTPSCVAGKIAAALSVMYLPPLPPVIKLKTPRPLPPSKLNAPESSRLQRAILPKRTSLRQEIELATAAQDSAPGYKTRKDLDLKRVVEDQWRKELQVMLEEEETVREQNLADAQHAKENALAKMVNSNKQGSE